MDLAKFFDTVNHSKLLQVLSNEIKDGRVISLIHRYLRVKIIDGNKAIKNKVGLHLGNNFSPVCANILLNELDQELEKRGVKFVRYA
ncbi:reverse transcriptase domain-containing protein [Anaerobiospirillum thomasii]|nr:reverse transcriptase domain-containing protein [Anaerobiospirillum thomasii]